MSNIFPYFASVGSTGIVCLTYFDGQKEFSIHHHCLTYAWPHGTESTSSKQYIASVNIYIYIYLSLKYLNMWNTKQWHDKQFHYVFAAKVWLMAKVWLIHSVKYKQHLLFIADQLTEHPYICEWQRCALLCPIIHVLIYSLPMLNMSLSYERFFS